MKKSKIIVVFICIILLLATTSYAKDKKIYVKLAKFPININGQVMELGPKSFTNLSKIENISLEGNILRVMAII